MVGTPYKTVEVDWCLVNGKLTNTNTYLLVLTEERTHIETPKTYLKKRVGILAIKSQHYLYNPSKYDRYMRSEKIGKQFVKKYCLCIIGIPAGYFK